MSLRRRAALAALLAASALLAACAHHPPATPTPDAQAWQGRLSLTVASEPPQALHAQFTLQGHAEAGRLSLDSPLGSTLAVLQWQPGQAELLQGGQARQYDSLDALAQEATGAALPLAALFDWLQGRDTPAPGWQADLGQISHGRLSARRLMPLPEAELRVILDP